MKREIEYKGIKFFIGNYTPRKNEYEKGLKYKLYVKRYSPITRPDGEYIPTDSCFETIRQAKEWIKREWMRY